MWLRTRRGLLRSLKITFAGIQTSGYGCIAGGRPGRWGKRDCTEYAVTALKFPWKDTFTNHITEVDHVATNEVGGWLLVFSILLTIIYPGVTLFHIATQDIPKIVDTHNRSLEMLLAVYSTLFGMLALFGIFAGLRLWLIKPGAVKFARYFLISYLCTHFVYFGFWFLVCRPTQAASLAAMGWWHVVGPIPFVTLWYSYLEHSRRVHATYQIYGAFSAT
jgi:hypothetical protein